MIGRIIVTDVMDRLAVSRYAESQGHNLMYRAAQANRLFSLLRDNRQQQEHWRISVSSNKDAVLLAEPKKPEEKL